MPFLRRNRSHRGVSFNLTSIGQSLKHKRFEINSATAVYECVAGNGKVDDLWPISTGNESYCPIALETYGVCRNIKNDECITFVVVQNYVPVLSQQINLGIDLEVWLICLSYRIAYLFANGHTMVLHVLDCFCFDTFSERQP